MRRTLVTYYSRTGYSRRVAAAIAEGLRADTEEIHDARYPAARIGRARGFWEAWLGRAAPIEAPRRMPSSYDLVVVCGPVWGSRLSGAVRAYLERYGMILPAVACVATTTHNGADRVLAQMRALVDPPPVAELAITEDEIECNGWSSGLPHFLDALRAYMHAPSPGSPTGAQGTSISSAPIAIGRASAPEPVDSSWRASPRA